MSDRRLVVAECDATSADKGKMFALAPGQAAGIGLPAFDLGNGLPPAGSVIGQGFYDKLHRKGVVWDGTAWRDITPSPITAFATQAALTADTTTPTGTYATAGDTGNLFVKQAAGWRMLGIAQYATATDLLADNPVLGTLGEALDEDTLWERTATGWRLLVVREMADTAAVLAWANGSPGASIGDRAIDTTNDVGYIRTSTGWKPTTIWADTEANIRAAGTWPVEGQEAISTDTGRTYVYAAGVWIEEPIQHYTTEADLLAAGVSPGVLAWADDTNVVFTRSMTGWKRLQGPQISYGTTAPSTPGVGDQWFDSSTTSTTKQSLQVYGGGAWHPVAPPVSSFCVGSVQQSLLTEAQWATAMGAEAANWVLADGRSVAGSRYATITGQSKVPDLRGMFLRGAGTHGTQGWQGGVVGSWRDWTTGRPRTADFVVDSQGAHHHSYSDPLTRNTSASGNPGIKGDPALGAGEAVLHPGTGDTTTAGGHTHTVTSGGDHETAPVHLAANHFIKIN